MSAGPAWIAIRTPLGTAAKHALVSLPALNGLRVSEATGADSDALGTERWHPALVIIRKGGKVRAIDLAIGERCEGPVFLAPDRRRMDRHGAGRIMRRIARRAGITKKVGPHTARSSSRSASR